MWSSLTLRNRVAALLCALLLALLAVTLAGLWMASIEDFAAEREPFERQSAQVAASMNSIVNATRDPGKVIAAFETSLEGSNGTVRFSKDRPTSHSISTQSFVPDWFLNILPLHAHHPRSYPLKYNDETLGYMTFVQDMFPDILEKWVTFVAVCGLFFLFALGSLFVVYFGVGSMLKPLESIAEGLSRVERNETPDIAEQSGPPEIARLARKVNQIGQTLQQLRGENEQLLHSVVTAQDRERDEISRDLHDELGPLLFALRAGVVSLQEVKTVSTCRDRAAEMEQAIETLQGVHRQILERLRPMELSEIGLRRSILALIDRAMSLDESLTIDAHIDPAIDSVGQPVARTILRVVQESVLNVQRHAGAKTASVDLEIVHPDSKKPNLVRVAVTDDGRGVPSGFKLGRGLSGIKERARALGGHFEINGGSNGTTILCTLPLRP